MDKANSRGNHLEQQRTGDVIKLYKIYEICRQKGAGCSTYCKKLHASETVLFSLNVFVERAQ